MGTNLHPPLQESVIFLCKHDANGSMGFFLNQPLEGVTLSDLTHQIDLYQPIEMVTFPIWDPMIGWGGPTENNRGFILHGFSEDFPNTIRVNHRYAVTYSFECLQDIVSGKYPSEHCSVFLGYMEWNKDQLEKELNSNVWAVVPATAPLVFEIPFQEKYSAALRSIGLSVEDALLSGSVYPMTSYI